MKQEKNTKSSKEMKRKQLRKMLLIITIVSALIGTTAGTVFEAIAFPKIAESFQNPKIGVFVALYAGGIIGFVVMAAILIAGKVFVERQWQKEQDKNPGSSLI